MLQESYSVEAGGEPIMVYYCNGFFGIASVDAMMDKHQNQKKSNRRKDFQANVGITKEMVLVGGLGKDTIVSRISWHKIYFLQKKLDF